jgi:signal transduction histidine kinase
VRVRTTFGAVAVVGTALLIGAVALVSVQRETLRDGVRDAARLRAEEVAGDLKASSEPAALAVGDEDEHLIQVVGTDGQVVASSGNMAGRPALVQLRPGQSTTVHAPVGDDEFIVVAVAAETSTGPVTVMVGRELDNVTESTNVLVSLLLPGIPALMLLVGLTTWRVVGRALGPVEAIRREVDEISSSQMHRRVPEPAGHDEVARLAATMNRMLARLEDALVRQRRFVSDASHELRSPVASIRQHAEVALAHPDRMTLAELADTVLAEDLRVQRLVEDLLLLARADEGIGPSAQAVDLDDIVFDVADGLRHTAPVTVDTAGVSAGRVRGEPAQLRRLVGNLADNAARHARSRVAISLGEVDGSVVLRVDDDGGGIPADQRLRVFERFVRLDEARARDDGGVGLGLAIVAQVAATHGGTATAAASPAGGARLEVRLPVSGD